MYPFASNGKRMCQRSLPTTCQHVQLREGAFFHGMADLACDLSDHTLRISVTLRKNKGQPVPSGSHRVPSVQKSPNLLLLFPTQKGTRAWNSLVFWFPGEPVLGEFSGSIGFPREAHSLFFPRRKTAHVGPRAFFDARTAFGRSARASGEAS